jgi:hypothetical protein
LSDAYSDAVFLGVNDESPTVIERTRRNLGLSFPSAYDSNGAIADLFGVRALPTTIVIDRNGLIVEAIEGFRRDGAVIRAIELAQRGSVSLLNGHSDAQPRRSWSRELPPRPFSITAADAATSSTILKSGRSEKGGPRWTRNGMRCSYDY